MLFLTSGPLPKCSAGLSMLHGCGITANALDSQLKPLCPRVVMLHAVIHFYFCSANYFFRKSRPGATCSKQLYNKPEKTLRTSRFKFMVADRVVSCMYFIHILHSLSGLYNL